jgi:hypothetical protein
MNRIAKCKQRQKESHIRYTLYSKPVEVGRHKSQSMPYYIFRAFQYWLTLHLTGYQVNFTFFLLGFLDQLITWHPHNKFNMELDDSILKTIAEELDMGMKCFLDKETSELVIFPEEEDLMEDEVSPWKEEIDKVETNPEKFIEFERMRSDESFRCMEWFIDDVENETAKEKLMNAITRKRPFAHFKDQLREFPEILEEWYKFKESCLIDFVKGQLPIN